MPKQVVTRPEETDDNIRIPVADSKPSDTIRTIIISDSEGIKALYAVERKLILTYLFSKAKGWTMEKAKKWVADHKKDATGMVKRLAESTEMVSRTVIGKKQERIFTFEKGTIDEEKRTVDLSFSSEEPGERWYGWEILDHQVSSIRLKRMNNGGAALFNHKTDNHIGTIEPGTAHIDTDSRKGRAMVRFGKGVQASEKFQDVKDGILRNVSVGYWVHKIVLEKEEDEKKYYRVTDWEPLEISFVPIPMDASVGVGRSAEEEVVVPPVIEEPEEVTKIEEVKMPEEIVDVAKATKEAVELRQKEVVEILAIGKKFGKDAEASEAVGGGKSLAEFKDLVLAGIEKTPVITVTKDAAEKKKEEGFPTFGHFLQAVVRSERRGATLDPRLVFERAISGSSETVPSDGGFLVQDTFTNDLLKLTHDVGVLYPKCRIIPIGAGSNGIVANVIDESSRATGSRFGGVQVYRDGEAEAATAKKPKFGKIDMKLIKLHGLWYATDEILQDATQLEAIGKVAFAEEMAFTCDNEIIRGTGAGEMLGILNAGCLVSIAEETGQTDDTIVSENILKMYQAMPARSLANAVWLYNSECFSQLATMYVSAGVGGVVGFMPPGGLSGTPYGTLMGRPLLPIEQASAIGDVGDIIFADLSEYLIIEKGQMEAAGSIHVRFIYDEMTFKFTWRNNGQPIWKSALSPFKGAVSKSPFVALAAR